MSARRIGAVLSVAVGSPPRGGVTATDARGRPATTRRTPSLTR